MSEKEWNGKSKGNKYGYLFFIYSVKLLPLNFSYFFVSLVAYFYYLFTPKQTANLAGFYAVVFPSFEKSKIKRLVRSNYKKFAQTLLDRVAFLSNKKKKFSFEFEGHEKIENALEEKKGLFLIGSHLGNWEIAGEMLSEKGVQAKVNVVLVDQEAEHVKKVLEKAKRPNSFSIIPIKQDFSHIILIQRALKNNEIVCVLGDRFLPGSRTIETDFFGRQISLPLGIFKFIEKFQSPTLFFYNVKVSNFKYKLVAKSTSLDQNAKEVAGHYTLVLENMVKSYPDQFYNYFNFFDEE